jgi:nitronate monooxygenase
MLRTSLCELLEIAVPIIQAPFGSALLASIVSEAGGLGHISITWRTPEEIHTIIKEIQSLTSRPFAVNLVANLEPTGETARLESALEAGIRVVTFHWSDSSKFYSRVHAAGAKVIQLVTSTQEATRAEEAGADALVVQGWEAGGHVRSRVALLPLLPKIVDRVGIPVIAAGGIADGRGIAAALTLGASGVWLGTRFLVAEESGFHSVYKDSVIAANEGDTVFTELFDGGWPDAPHRVLRNSTVTTWEQAGQPSPGERPGEGEEVAKRSDASKILRYAEDSPKQDMIGNVEAMALYAGQSVGLVTKVQRARGIMQQLISETISAIQKQQSWLT